MTVNSSIDTAKLTPMLRQYYEIKESVGDAILFFRMGDFFEIFGNDAEEVAPKLDVTLTAREKGDQTKIPFCGVPHHSAKGYWLKLVKLGYKVAICEQLEDAGEAKGLVKRGVTRMYSPGSIDELEGLEQDQPNYLMAWMDVPGHGEEVIAVVDVSTGEFRLGSIEPGQLLNYVKRFRPTELLIRRFAQAMVQRQVEWWMKENNLRLDYLPEAPMKDESLQRELLTAVFGSADLNQQQCGLVMGGGALASSLISYLQSMCASTNQFMRLQGLDESDSIALSETVIRDLEIFETSRRRLSEGSLARTIDRTLTPMGARYLRYSLANPLVNFNAITARHAAVDELVKSGEEKLLELRSTFKNTADLARLTTRILGGSASPHELSLVREALKRANHLSPKLMEISEDGSSLAKIAEQLVAAPEVLAILVDKMLEFPEGLGTGRGVFRSGVDVFLDEKNQLALNGEQQVASYEEKLRQQTGISSLKIKAHKSFGLLLEVTKTHANKVPEFFIRRQTMTNGERFTTVELRELDEALSSANDQAVLREAQMYQDLMAKLRPFRDGLMQVARAIGELDMLQGFAWLALKDNYVRPILTSKPRRLTLKSCRHPVVEKFVGKHEFVANDVLLKEGKSQMLITGPNMAGKSTVMRQTAIAAILCQAGAWVPALSAEMPIFDRIFTRVGASDDLSRGQSTFMVEMSEAAEILRQASNRSLVILDEVGRGTSTTDGLAIASSILEDLADRVGCFTMFATHYHELVPMMSARENVVPMRTEVKEDAKGISFTHRLVAGASESSFGIEVAKLAGVPAHVIEKAKKHLIFFEQKENDVRNTESSGAGRSLNGAEFANDKDDLATVKSIGEMMPSTLQGANAKMLSKVQKGLFGLDRAEESFQLDDVRDSGCAAKILARLENVKIHKTTPLQALNILNDIKTMMVPVKQRALFDDELHTQ